MSFTKAPFKPNFVKTRAMKKILLSLLLMLAVPGLRAQSDTLIGPHKGLIQTYTDYRIELVGCNDYLEIYIYTKKMNPIHNQHATGDVKYFYQSGEYSSSPLALYGADGFTAKIPSADYVYARVTALIDGVTLTAKFDNKCITNLGKN